MKYDGNTDEHNHLYCSNTLEIIDYVDEELNQMIRDYLSKKQFTNFEINDFELQIKGEKISPGKDVSIK